MACKEVQTLLNKGRRTQRSEVAATCAFVFCTAYLLFHEQRSLHMVYGRMLTRLANPVHRCSRWVQQPESTHLSTSRSGDDANCPRRPRVLESCALSSSSSRLDITRSRRRARAGWWTIERRVLSETIDSGNQEALATACTCALCPLFMWLSVSYRWEHARSVRPHHGRPYQRFPPDSFSLPAAVKLGIMEDAHSALVDGHTAAIPMVPTKPRLSCACS